MGSQESVFAEAMVRAWGGWILSVAKHYEQQGGEELSLYKQVCSEFFDSFCQLVFLMELEEPVIVMFLKIYQLT